MKVYVVTALLALLAVSGCSPRSGHPARIAKQRLVN
jgi:hypothetical protein